MMDLELPLFATRAELYSDSVQREMARTFPPSAADGLFAASRTVALDADGDVLLEAEHQVWFWTASDILRMPPAIIEDASALARAGAANFLSFEQAIFAHEIGLAVGRMHNDWAPGDEFHALCHPAGLIVLRKAHGMALTAGIKRYSASNPGPAMESCAAVVLDKGLSNHATLEALTLFEHFLELYLRRIGENFRHQLKEILNEDVHLKPRLQLQ